LLPAFLFHFKISFNSMAVLPELRVQGQVGVGAAVQSVERAMADLRRGASVVICSGNERLRVIAAEALTEETLARFGKSTTKAPRMVVTGQRAKVLGLSDSRTQACIISMPGGLDLETVDYLADPCAEASCESRAHKVIVGPARAVEHSSLALMKLARLLPAAVVSPVTDVDPDVLEVSAEDILAYPKSVAMALQVVSQARVPLEDAENTRIVAFRPSDGGIEHLAIIVGDPDTSEPVLVRIHSECFTGDLLGSMRCDCGSQLRGAIASMASAGSGVVLYLAQEGRGIGLINKLRAYQLQDAGFDTVDANLQLGFDEDERVYLPAARMLSLLGIDRVRLMTNNPNKVGALSHHGVDVVERVAHIFPANRHNEGYLRTKATKAGHLF